jgi:hypothetical protein
MLKAEAPNLEMHIYGNGSHSAPREGTPFATWSERYIEWFKDLGFLDKPGTPTKAAADVESYAKKSAK